MQVQRDDIVPPAVAAKLTRVEVEAEACPRLTAPLPNLKGLPPTEVAEAGALERLPDFVTITRAGIQFLIDAGELTAECCGGTAMRVDCPYHGAGDR